MNQPKLPSDIVSSPSPPSNRPLSQTGGPSASGTVRPDQSPWYSKGVELAVLGRLDRVEVAVVVSPGPRIEQLLGLGPCRRSFPGQRVELPKEGRQGEADQPVLGLAVVRPSLAEAEHDGRGRPLTPE